MFEENEVRESTLEYFGGDELATNVFMTKYCLKDKKGRPTRLKLALKAWGFGSKEAARNFAKRHKKKKGKK